MGRGLQKWALPKGDKTEHCAKPDTAFEDLEQRLKHLPYAVMFTTTPVHMYDASSSKMPLHASEGSHTVNIEPRDGLIS